jgi:EmrB/QacA subfamily drug resistance transporter
MALVALALAVFVVANDFTALSVAMPSMEADLDADVTTIQWVINAYALVFGVLIITGGRLADMFGRRRIFFVGAGIFAVFSVFAGAAPNAELLIAGRALMGIGGALMWPAVLGLTYQVLPDSRQGLAGPLVLGVAGMGNAFGPILGGVLTDELSWRWVLFLNLPIAALACGVTLAKVKPVPGDPGDGKLDYSGVAALSIGLVALLLAFDQVGEWGWGDARIVGLFGVCAASLAAFGAIERRAGPRALIPADVASNRTFASACLAVLLMSVTFFALLLYAPQVMQKLMGFSALQSGLGFLPMMLTFSVMSFVAGPLYERFGGKLLLTIGAACLPVGVLLVSLVQVDSSYVAIVPGLAIAGVGVGLFYATITTVAVTALDPGRAGLAGGIVYMFQIAGGAVGLGLTTTIFTTVAAGDADSIAAATAAPLAAAEAFVAGVHAALRVDAGIAAAGFLVTLLFVGGRLHPPRRTAEQPPSEEPAATARTAG